MIGVAQLGRILLREQGSGRIRKDQHRARRISGGTIRNFGSRIIRGNRCLIVASAASMFGSAIDGIRGNRGRCKSQQIIKALAPHLRFHDHAGAAADRGVIHGMMHVVRPIAQIVRLNGDQALRLRLAEKTEVQHFEILREHGHDIDLHTAPQ